MDNLSAGTLSLSSSFRRRSAQLQFLTYTFVTLNCAGERLISRRRGPLQGHFAYFLSENRPKCTSLVLRCLTESLGELTKDDIADDFDDL